MTIITSLTFLTMTFANFGFPYENPYSIQLELMNDIYQTIDKRKIGFYESPTGTVIFYFEILTY